MMKIEGSGSESGSISQRHGLRIRIRIHTKMSWIRNTGFEACCKEEPSLSHFPRDFSPALGESLQTLYRQK
jgi:hypothetical protein